MKKKALFWGMAAALLFSACQPKNQPEAIADGALKGTIEQPVVEGFGAQTRAGFGQSFAFNWQENDKIMVLTSAGSKAFMLQNGAGTATGTFVGSLASGETVSNKVASPYASGNTLTATSTSMTLPAEYDYGSNTTFTTIPVTLPCWAPIVSNAFTMSHLVGYMAFEISNIPAGANKFVLTTEDKRINGAFTADLTAGTPIFAAVDAANDAEKTVTINFTASAEVTTHCFVVPIPVGTYTYDWYIKADNALKGFGNGENVVVGRGQIKGCRVACAEIGGGEPDPTPDPSCPEGAINSLFSVSATKQVYFSKGNLQYQASTNTWRFAEHQYDMVGIGYGITDGAYSNYIAGNVQNSDNRQISSTYSGWIDLFGWGTGNNPTNTSYNDLDYTFIDWGENPISNGGNQADQWRTLTMTEWQYIIYNRPNADAKKGVATVAGINGLVLLPDEWTLPTGLAFTPGLAVTSGWQHYQSVNNYTAQQWSQLEYAGAIFLPASGYRNGTSISGLGKTGYYWSSTEPDDYFSYYQSFDSKFVDRWNSFQKAYGTAIRLCKESTAANPEPEPEVDPYNGHAYVDLGLPSGLKWATMNVGATAPEEAGLYFAWGETQGYTSNTSDGYSFNGTNYKWMAAGQSSWQYVNKYTFADGQTSAFWYQNGNFIGDYKTVLDPEDDAASVDWGGKWRMPTEAEWTELCTNCTWTWTTVNGINGYRVLGANNSSIFLPASGYRNDTFIDYVGSNGYYWSSSLNTDDSSYAYYVYFNSSVARRGSNLRYYGRSVRAVCQ